MTEGVHQDLNGAPSKTIRTAVFDGKLCMILEPKTLTLQANKSSYTESSPYLLALAWPISDADSARIAKATDNHGFLPEILNQAGWKVGQNDEIAGRPCAVV